MKKYYIVITIIIAVQNILAQDIHFSNADVAPMFINPAYTAKYKGSHRGTLVYKDQWSQIGAPYKTFLASYDMPLFMRRFPNDRIGIGVYAYSDKAGAAGMGVMQLNISGSYQKLINSNLSMGVGFQGGFSQRGFNAGKLTWDSQWDGDYNASLSSQEPVYDNQFYYLDFSTGLQAEYRYNKYYGVTGGISLYHVQPTELNFYTAAEAHKLFRRFTVHTRGELKAKRMELTFMPEVLYSKHGPIEEVVYGCMAKYQLSEGKNAGRMLETTMQLGIFNRYGDAFILAARFSYMHYTIGISYDITISRLSRVNSNRGGAEISLIYVAPYEKRSKGSALM